jgi:hypothetical protein
LRPDGILTHEKKAGGQKGKGRGKPLISEIGQKPGR